MWQKLRKIVKGSETIAWAYIQGALGIIALVVTYVDPSYFYGVVPPKWLPYALLANAVFTKYLRERRDPDLGKEEHADDSQIRGV